MAHETYRDYSPGSECLPWKGWLEDEAGKAAGFVDISGRVFRLDPSGNFADVGEMSPRNGAWNAVRDAVASAREMSLDDKTDYWPASAIGCVLSIAMKEVMIAVSRSQSKLNRARLGRLHDTLEAAFALDNTFFSPSRP